MNQIGTPLPALSPHGGERVAEGRERGWFMENLSCFSCRTQLASRVRSPVNCIAPAKGDGTLVYGANIGY